MNGVVNKMLKEEDKERLKERSGIYPINKIVERVNKVSERFFGRRIEELKRENTRELDQCRRKYRAKYYAQQYSIYLDEKAKNIIERHEGELLYENDYGIITYLLTYFWRSYPMLKFILSEYVGEFPFLNKRKIKVLDVGTGVGTIPLAFSHFIEDLSDITGLRFGVEYYLCDRIEKMRDVSAILCSDLNIKTVSVEPKNWVWELQDFLHRHNFDSRIDLITISYLLSELPQDECVELLKELLPFLDEDGRIIVIEPYSFITALGRITADVAKVNLANVKETKQPNMTFIWT